MSGVATQAYAQSTHDKCDASIFPEGWVQATIGAVTDLNPSKPLQDALPPDAPVTFVPMPAVDAYSGTITMPEDRPFGAVRKGYTSFRDNDVIFAKITPCMENGKAAIARDLTNGLGFGSTEFHVLRSNGAAIPDYLFHYIRQESFRGAAEAAMTGSVGQKRVPVDFLKNALLPLPPLSEQKRIMAKVEQLLARVNAARDRLAKVPAILKRFRQSVLAAACSGRLTADWRENNTSVTSSELSIREILRLHQKQWVLEKGSAKKYKQPKSVRTERLPEVPESWKRVSSDALFSFVTSGSRGWAKYYSESGSTFIRIGNLDHDTITLDLSQIKRVNPPRGAERQRTRVRPGDILVSITADVGMIALVPDGIGEAYVNQHVAIARPVAGVYQPWLAWYLASAKGGHAQFQNLQRGATKIGLGLDDIRSVTVPFPPVEEQKEIAKRIELFFKMAAVIEKRVTAATANSEKLTQAILAKAFRGELAPTEAEVARREGRSYELASALVAKIEAQKKGVKPHRKRGRS